MGLFFSPKKGKPKKPKKSKKKEDNAKNEKELRKNLLVKAANKAVKLILKADRLEVPINTLINGKNWLGGLLSKFNNLYKRGLKKLPKKKKRTKKKQLIQYFKSKLVKKAWFEKYIIFWKYNPEEKVYIDYTERDRQYYLDGMNSLSANLNGKEYNPASDGYEDRTLKLDKEVAEVKKGYFFTSHRNARQAARRLFGNEQERKARRHLDPMIYKTFPEFKKVYDKNLDDPISIRPEPLLQLVEYVTYKRKGKGPLVSYFKGRKYKDIYDNIHNRMKNYKPFKNIAGQVAFLENGGKIEWRDDMAGHLFYDDDPENFEPIFQNSFEDLLKLISPPHVNFEDERFGVNFHLHYKPNSIFNDILAILKIAFEAKEKE